MECMSSGNSGRQVKCFLVAVRKMEREARKAERMRQRKLNRRAIEACCEIAKTLRGGKHHG